MIITNHKTIFACSAEQLDALIENAIADGWQPIGGVTAASEPGRGVALYRAMARYEPSASIGSVWNPEDEPMTAVITTASTSAGKRAKAK